MTGNLSRDRIRERLVLIFQTPVKEGPNEHYDRETLIKAIGAAVDLETELDKWGAENEKKKSEKWQSLHYILHKQKKELRVRMVSGDLKAYDVVRMTKADFESEEERANKE